MTVIGVDGHDKLKTVVYARSENGRWEPISKRMPASIQTGLLLTVDDSGGKTRLCHGFSTANRDAQLTPRIRCADGGDWYPIHIPTRLTSMDLMDMYSVNGQTIALFSHAVGASDSIQLARIEEDAVVPLGPVKKLPSSTLAVLAQKTSDGSDSAFDVSVESLVSGRRWMISLEDGQWTKSSQLPQTITGPMVSGGVRDKQDLYFPVVEAPVQGKAAFKWPFSVFSIPVPKVKDGPWTEVDGGSFNVGKGSAQGSLDAVADEVWASWGENVWNNYKAMPTRYYAAKLDEGTMVGEPILIWKGVTGAASQTQVAPYKDGQAFLFLRRLTPSSGTKATVMFRE